MSKLDFDFSLSEIVEGVFKPLMDTIDEVHTSEEEKMEKQRQIIEAWSSILDKALHYQQQVFNSQARIVEAEAKSDGILARNWRPLVMLMFSSVIMLRFFGYSAPGMTEEEYLKLWNLLTFGLGGYVVGRSGEKITQKVMDAMKERKND